MQLFNDGSKVTSALNAPPFFDAGAMLEIKKEVSAYGPQESSLLQSDMGEQICSSSTISRVATVATGRGTASCRSWTRPINSDAFFA